MKQLAEFVPIALFFIVYQLKGESISLGGWEYTFDGIFTATGVLIYSVDAKLATGQNQVVVYPKNESDLMHAPFQPGDSFEHKDAPMGVKVVKKNKDGSFQIEVEVGEG